MSFPSGYRRQTRANADKMMLRGLKVGQKVKFQAEMVGGKATVMELKPAR
jgi:Cu/Ag efflux protein CusF